MKSGVMFVAGAVMATGLVLLVTRRSTEAPPPVESVQTAAQALPEAPVPEVAEPAPEPPPEPEARSARRDSKPSAMPARQQKVRREPVRRPEPVPAAVETPIERAETAPPPAASVPYIPEAKSEPTPVPVARVEEPKPVAPPPEPKTVTIQAGTLLTVRVDETLSSSTNTTGDSFRATLDQPLVVDGFVIAERGSRVEGRITEADRGGRVKGVAQLGLELVLLSTSDGQRVRLATESFSRKGEKNVKKDAAKIGVAAGIGAAIGAIAGGGKGAAIGAAAGGAAGTGGVMATRGEAAEIPAETRVSFRLREPVTITEKLD